MLHPDSANLTDVEQVDEIVFQAMSAQDAYLQMDQKSIDWIVSNMAGIGAANHLSLAKKVVSETGRGIIEDKSISNIFATSGLEQKLRHIQTVGCIEDNNITGSRTFAEPVGIIAAFANPDHPTASILAQAILSVKTRNPVIFCFHSTSQKSAEKAASLMQKAALEAGAPPHAIQWLPESSGKSINALTENPEISLILMDEDTFSLPAQAFQEVPILGMGQVNTPCFVDRSADIEQAAADIVASKHFDHGLVTTAEQTVIITREIYFQTLDLMMQMSCHRASEHEKELLEELLFDLETGIPNPKCTGLDAHTIAEMAGFAVPPDTKLILAEIGGVGFAYPLSRSKAVPVLSILAAESWYEGLCICEAVLEFSSASHTAVLHARDKNLSEEFAARLKVTHTILNQSATRGDLCNLTVTTGSALSPASDRQAGNPATALLSVDMLIHRQLVQKPQLRLREWKTPEKVIFSPECSAHLRTLTGMERTLIVTEKELVNSDHIDRVLQYLNNQSQSVEVDIFCKTNQVANITTIEKGLECMEQFRPTSILAVGNGATIDNAKSMRYFYQRPESGFSDPPPDLHRADFPNCPVDPPHKSVTLVAIPTTAGACFAINPFVTIFNDSRAKRRNLHSCELLPDITLIDPEFSVKHDPHEMVLIGMTILSHTIEAYVSPLASDYSDSMALKAIRLLFDHLPKAGSAITATREKIYSAASMAGMAAGHAKLGINHAMAHSIGGFFRLHHDLAASVLLSHTIQYNGVEVPSRFNPLMPGSRYIAHERYQEIARSLGLPCKSPEQGLESLLNAINNLQMDYDLPRRFRDCDIDKQEYMAKVEQMAEQAFEDHSTATNPRLPLIKEIMEIYDALY
jgi:acetaldehyde dehydrogenase / alcohol dehydrogenase